MTEFPHLFPGAGRIAALSAEERILRIRADRWVSYPRAEAALTKLETLLAFPSAPACRTCSLSATAAWARR